MPQEATYESQDKILVMKVERSADGSSVAHAKTIEVSDRSQGVYVVKSGIDAGDEIIVKGVRGISDGSPVKTNIIPFETAIKSFAPVFEK